MREAIYNTLSKQSKKITHWLQPYVASPSTPKPFGVIQFQGRIPENVVSTFQDFTVWVYFEDGDFIPIDEAVKEIKQILHRRRLLASDGRLFEVKWTMDGRDFYDDALKAFAMNIEFTIPGGVY